jgi:hypothetical protein
VYSTDPQYTDGTGAAQYSSSFGRRRRHLDLDNRPGERDDGHAHGDDARRHRVNSKVGSSTLTITGTSGTLSHTATAGLTSQ